VPDYRASVLCNGDTQEVPVDAGSGELQNQLESLLEEVTLSLSCQVSDLLGVSAQRMLKALADGEPTRRSGRLADRKCAPHRNNCVMRSVRARPQAVYRRLLRCAEQLQFLDQQIGQLTRRWPCWLNPHQDAVTSCGGARSGSGSSREHHCRSRSTPGDISFRRNPLLLGWCPAPATDESAGVNYSHRSPKGNRHMRRVLNQRQRRSQDQRSISRLCIAAGPAPDIIKPSGRCPSDNAD